MANDYAGITAALATLLNTALTTAYSDIKVVRGVFQPDFMPSGFGRYAVVIAPSLRPWEERRIAVRELQDIYRAEIFTLVRNWDDEKSLFGTDSGEKGLFELVKDVKDTIRGSDLDGLLEKTYDEAAGDSSKGGGGPVEFGTAAVKALDSGSFTLVHRARVPFVGRGLPHCHDLV